MRKSDRYNCLKRGSVAMQSEGKAAGAAAAAALLSQAKVVVRIRIIGTDPWTEHNARYEVVKIARNSFCSPDGAVRTVVARFKRCINYN